MRSVFALFFALFVVMFFLIIYGVSVSPVARGWLAPFVGCLFGLGFSSLCFVMEGKRRE